MKVFEAKNLAETKRIARNLARGIFSSDKARVIALSGDLGSGKTSFTQFFSEAIGVGDRITSPTFVIMKKYSINKARHSFVHKAKTTGFLSGDRLCLNESELESKKSYKKDFFFLYHFDAYRLKEFGDLEKLGWNEITANPKNIIVLEWPERVSGAVSTDAIRINFEFIDKNKRRISFLTPFRLNELDIQ